MSESREHFVDHSFEPPSGAVEESVARIIADVLDVDQVGRTDSFYDLGGTSLQAIRISARIETEFGCQVQPVWLFAHDVVADFARKVDAERVRATDTDE